MAETPQSCLTHESNYEAKAWEAYSLTELGNWVHLFTKRAEHRTNFAKRDKDLVDAQNYLNMMQSKLNEAIQVSLEKFARAIIQVLECNSGVTQLSHETTKESIYTAFVLKDDEPIGGFEDVWKMHIHPAALALVKQLNDDGVNEVYRLEIDREVAPLGSRISIAAGEQMLVRLTSSYQVEHKGVVMSIEVGVK